jgi:tetratricopeptide (TPR) repeat protein
VNAAKRLSLAALLALAVAVALTMVALAAPTLTVISSQVTIRSDGKRNIKYQLSFLENEPRDKITTLGPFDSGSQMLDATLEGPVGASPVNLVSQGGDKYTANFGLSTQPGKTYTVTVRYKVDRALAATRAGADDLRVVSWAPPIWNLAIGEQIVTFITPIELPASVSTPEQVTSDVVKTAGLLEDSANKAAFDQWIYYPTPDSSSGKNYLSLYVSKQNIGPNDALLVKFYLPARYFATLPPTPGTVPAGTTSSAPPEVSNTPTDPPVPAPASTVYPALDALFVCLGSILASIIGLVIFLIARPRREPVTYQPRKIGLETFEKRGLVPDLSAVEGALHAGNNARALEIDGRAKDWRHDAALAERTDDMPQLAAALRAQGMLSRAAELLEDSGELSQALDLREQSQEWERAEILARKLGLWERQAQALQARGLLVQAGEAYERGARGLLERTPPSEEESARLYEAAAACYAQEEDWQHQQSCWEIVCRLRRLPNLRGRLEVEDPLWERESAQVGVAVRNVGHGPARDIVVKEISPRFGLDANESQRGIKSLAPQHEMSLRLSLQPRPDTLGTVMLIVVLGYADEAGRRFEEKVETFVRVRGRDEKTAELAHVPAGVQPQFNLAPGAKAVFGGNLVEGDEVGVGAQKGDRVELHRGESQRTSPGSDSTDSPQPLPAGPVCPHCGGRLQSADSRFCSECGHRLARPS